jgi:hypothetical protein
MKTNKRTKKPKQTPDEIAMEKARAFVRIVAAEFGIKPK